MIEVSSGGLHWEVDMSTGEGVAECGIDDRDVSLSEYEAIDSKYDGDRSIAGIYVFVTSHEQ